MYRVCRDGQHNAGIMLGQRRHTMAQHLHQHFQRLVSDEWILLLRRFLQIMALGNIATEGITQQPISACVS